MEVKPQVREVVGGKIWNHEFNSFKATVYVPNTELPEDVINFGFEAPYNIIFTEEEMPEVEMIDFAKKTGLESIAN